MIIWHLLSNRWNSAITEYALSAARSLAALGHRSVFTPLAESPAEQRARAVSLEVMSVRSFGLEGLIRLRDLQAKVKPDVIIAYGGPETTLVKFLKPGPKIVRFRGQEIGAPGFLDVVKFAWAHAAVDLILVPSEAMARAIQAFGAKSPVKPVVLGCDENKFHRVRSHNDSTCAELVILGRLDPVKGHARFFEIFNEVRVSWQRPERLRLKIIGEPANLSVRSLTEVALKCGLKVGDDVEICADRVEDIAKSLSSAVLGVVPSIGSEIIVRVAEEFLLCGTPIVVSGVGSLAEILFAEAGESYMGLSTSEAATVVKTWLERSIDEGEAAKKARAETAREYFALSVMGRKIDKLLNLLIKNNEM